MNFLVAGAIARRAHEQEGRQFQAYYAGWLSHDFKDGFPAYRKIFPEINAAPPKPMSEAQIRANITAWGSVWKFGQAEAVALGRRGAT